MGKEESISSVKSTIFGILLIVIGAILFCSNIINLATPEVTDNPPLGILCFVIGIAGFLMFVRGALLLIDTINRLWGKIDNEIRKPKEGDPGEV